MIPSIPGGSEMLVVLGVVVLLFGAKRIPRLARSTGQAIGEFRKGRDELEDEIDAATDGGESTHDDVNPGGEAE